MDIYICIPYLCLVIIIHHKDILSPQERHQNLKWFDAGTKKMSASAFSNFIKLIRYNVQRRRSRRGAEPRWWWCCWRSHHEGRGLCNLHPTTKYWNRVMKHFNHQRLKIWLNFQNTRYHFFMVDDLMASIAKTVCNIQYFTSRTDILGLCRGEVGKCDTLFDLRPRIRLGPVWF